MLSRMPTWDGLLTSDEQAIFAAFIRPTPLGQRPGARVHSGLPAPRTAASSCQPTSWNTSASTEDSITLEPPLLLPGAESSHDASPHLCGQFAGPEDSAVEGDREGGILAGGVTGSCTAVGRLTTDLASTRPR